MASCAAYAQEQGHLLEQKVTISFKESTVANVLKKLENEVEGMVFMYSPSTLDLKREISESFEQIPLKEVLSKIFQGLNIEFREIKNKLLLKPGKPKAKGGNISAKSEIRKDAGNLPKRRRIIAVKTAARDNSLTNDVKVRVIPQVTKTGLATSQFQENTLNVKEELPQRERKAIPKLENHQSFHFQPILRSQYRGPVQLQEDSSYVSDRLYKRLLAKEKRYQERANETKKFRIYGSSYTGYTQVNGKAGIQIGGSLIWLKDKRWGFGLSGYAVQSSMKNDVILLNQYRLAAGYGGLTVEYTHRPTDRIHFSFPFMIGGGGIAYNRSNDVNLNDGQEPTEDSRAFFVMESGAMVEANVIKYVRVGLGLSYRLTSSTLLSYQNNPAEITGKSALTGLNFGLTVKFGLF